MHTHHQNNHRRYISTDQVHNQNAYRFLRQLRLPRTSCELIPELTKIQYIQQHDYDKGYAYGNLYTQFMGRLDRIIATGALDGREWDEFFISLYKNNNHNLVETYWVIQDLVLDKSPSGGLVQHQLSQTIQDHGDNINQLTPAQAGTLSSIFFSMIHPYFKPSHLTALASERRYRYNANAQSQELRLVTQGQYHGYASRVDLVFKRFLRAQQHGRAENKSPITHIYFNNLPKDKSPYTYQRWFESSLTKSLQDLADDHPNIAVITLPADKGLMNHHDIAHIDLQFDRAATKQLFLEIALESESAKQDVRDFHISPKIRQMVFGTKENEKAVLSRLLDDSYQKMGLYTQSQLSAAQRQAVWVHFIKFELPQYIITVLQPDTYHFTCKDGIDRGGISSAYYNLLSSFTTDWPMSRDEFEQALHSAPFMHKGRGMNDHIKILWNAVDQYIAVQKLKKNQEWLIAWRDANCPAERVGELLERRLKECSANLETRHDSPIIAHARAVLQSISACDRSHTANHALFLDVVVSTYAFCQDPKQISNEKKLSHYDHLIEKMLNCDEHPVSWMQAFLKLLRYLCCMQQPRKTHTIHYANLIDKMGAWRSLPTAKNDTQPSSLPSNCGR